MTHNSLHKSKPRQKERLDKSEEAVHAAFQSAATDAGAAGAAAKQSLKHDKALNKGLPNDEQVT